MHPNLNLLGRRPSTPDARDFKLRDVREASPLELAFLRLQASRGANPAVKAWAAEVMAILAPPPPEPVPPATPPDQNYVWALPDPVLDQGDTPHCGGFGGAQWGNLSPVNDHYRNPDGHALYYEAVAIGGFPGTEDGVESRWVAKALQARGRLDTYAFAESVEEIVEWVRTRGPVMMGTDWTASMFEPDPEDGTIVVAPNGVAEVLGGHFWVIAGDLVEEGKVLGLNSWGESFGVGGFFRLGYDDLARLLVGLAGLPGDAIVSPELAL